MANSSSYTCTQSAGNGIIRDGSAHSFSLVLLIFFPIYIVASCAVFLYFQSSSVFLRKRPFHYILMSSVVSLTFLSFTAIYDYVGADHFPCLLLLLLFHFGNISLASLPMLFKVVQYANQTKSVQIGKQIRTQDREMSSAAAQMFNPYSVQSKATCQTLHSYFKVVFRGRTCTLEEKIECLQFMKSPAFLLLWTLVANICGIVGVAIRVGTDPDMRVGCTGCRISVLDASLQLASGTFGLVCGLSTMPFRVVKHDSLRILQEFSQCFASAGFTLLALVLYIADPGQVNALGVFNWLNISLLTAYFFLYIQTWHQVLMSKRIKQNLFHSKLDLEGCLVEIENDPVEKKELRRHLDTELSSEIYWFMDAVEVYRHSANSESNAWNIFDTYVKWGAKHEINLSSKIREECSRTINRGEFPATLFDECYRTLRDEFLRDGFLRYLAKKEKSTKAKQLTSVVSFSAAQ